MPDDNMGGGGGPPAPAATPTVADVDARIANAVAVATEAMRQEFATLSQGANVWSTSLEAKVAQTFQDLYGKSNPTARETFTLLDAECWIASDHYPALAATPSDAAQLREAAVAYVVASGATPSGAAVDQVRMAFDFVHPLLLDPTARSLPSSLKVYRQFVSVATFHANVANHGVPFAHFARQRHAVHNTEWAESQEASLKAFKAKGSLKSNS